jgi:Glycosyl hydrolases family 16
MQRTSDDLEDRLDVRDRTGVTELIARITAERGEPTGDGRDVREQVDVTELIARIAAERGEPDVQPDLPEQTGVGELIARIAAERGGPDDDRPDLPEQTDVGELIARIAAERGEFEDRPHAELDPRRSRRRRLAPAIAGMATVLVASTIALTLRARDDAPAGPELDAALVGSSSASSAPPPQPTAAIPAPAPQDAVAAPPGPSTLSPAAPPTSRRPAAASGAKPATPVVNNDGVQAARVNGWKLVDRDEFSGVLSPKWSKYDGEGNAGEGVRSPDAISVRNGAALIRGDANGTTGGMSWKDDRETGRWEMRAKFPKGDAQYHPVLLLWPEDGGSDDGEIDFAETTSASDSVSFFLHHGSGDQKSAKKQIDLTQWHNYAVEVTSDRVTGYIDGQKWFESTDRDTLPRGPVHPVIQLDWFPGGDSPEPSELLVDWMRIYE